MKVQAKVTCFILLLVFILCSLTLIYEIRFSDKSGQFGSTNENDTPSPQRPNNNVSQNSSSQNDYIRVLIGILTLPNRYNHRHFLRMIYGIQTYRDAKIDIKFVICNLTKTAAKFHVRLEIMRYDDIIILNCKENMNEGKTYTYFSSLPEIMVNDTNHPYPPYHYVMKADDDTYFRLENLVQSLRPLPRDDLYYGFLAPCNSNSLFEDYMAGMGYLVSWDLVEWVRKSEIPKRHMTGHEDMLFASWLEVGHKAKNRFDAKWHMYDIPDPPTSCTHKFWPDTIAVHKLKSKKKWIQTLNYFNVTLNLKPSKLYHISYCPGRVGLIM